LRVKTIQNRNMARQMISVNFLRNGKFPRRV
jgi:hypothetical protein